MGALRKRIAGIGCFSAGDEMRVGWRDPDAIVAHAKASGLRDLG